MKIVIDTNHRTEIMEQYKNSDELVIVSPFMSIVPKFHWDINKKLTIIIKDLDGKKYIDRKRFEFLKEILNKKISNLEIFDIFGLHSKIYLFKKDGLNFSARVTSANFTDNGTTKNFECGIFITEKERLKDIEKYILDLIKDKSPKNNDNFLSKIDELIENCSKNSEAPMDTQDISVENKPNRNYWLKPIGTKDENRTRNQNDKLTEFAKMCYTEECWFKHAKRKIQKDDILIVYLAGIKQIAFTCEVAEDIFGNTGNQRWKNKVRVKNRSKLFDILKPEFNLKTLQKEYLNTNVNVQIDTNGRKDFKGLCRQDRLMLDANFAKFILNKLSNIQAP